MIRAPKPRTLAAAKAEILQTMEIVGQRFGVREWSGTREVSGSFALRAALQLVDDGEAHLVRSVMRSDGRDEVYIKATKQPYPITDLGRQYGASHR